MDAQARLETLTDLAEAIGIVVRYALAAGSSPEHPGGALVRLKGREMLILDPTAAAEDQIGVVAAALRGRAEIENRFLPPEVRELIDQGA